MQIITYLLTYYNWMKLNLHVSSFECSLLMQKRKKRQYTAMTFLSETLAPCYFLGMSPIYWYEASAGICIKLPTRAVE